jgi:cytochrome oxidase Cu insertion factor (SCO1/SenC/PrrC family)
MRFQNVAPLVIIAICILGNAQQQTTNFTKVHYPTSAEPIKVGEIAPDFTLEDQDGHKITLSEARGKKPTVLVFYRGYW